MIRLKHILLEQSKSTQLRKWDKEPWRANFPNGKLISGDKNGTAELRWSNASYKGKLKNGYPDGYGVLTLDWYSDSDPDIYKGHWKNGLRHGHGVYIHQEFDITLTGKWHNDHLTGYAIASGGYYGHGTYKGQFKDEFTFHGYGVYTNRHGVKFCGKWIDNMLDGKSISDFENMKTSPYVCDKQKKSTSKFTYTDPNSPITMGPTDAWEYYFNNADQQWYTRKKGDSAWIKMIAKLPDTKMQKALDTLNRYVDSQNMFFNSKP